MPRRVDWDRAHRRSRARSGRIVSSVRPPPQIHTTRSSEALHRTRSAIATRALRGSFAPWSPGSARATAAETAAAAESTKTAATATKSSTATEPTASPSTAATSPTATHRDEDRQTSPAPAPTPTAPQHREENEQKDEIHERWNAAATSRLLPLPNRRRGLKRAVNLEVELSRESLGDPRRHQLETGAVVRLPEVRHRLVAESARRPIREKAFCAKSDFGADLAAAVLRRLLRNEENDDARIASGLAGIPLFADLPITPDRPRNVFDRPTAEIRQRDDDDFAAGLRAH